MAKRGRPPLPDGPSEKVELRVPRPVFDGLCRVALRRDKMPLRTLIREVLTEFLTEEKSGISRSG